MASVEPWPKRADSSRPPGGESDVDVLMRRFLEQAQNEEAAVQSVSVASSVNQAIEPRRNADTALDLLDRAAQAFELLITRHQDLEQELREAVARAEAEATESASTIDQWKQLALGLKDQLKKSDERLALMQSKFDEAEERAARADTRLREIEKSALQAVDRASKAEERSTKIHDKVINTFGIGSRMRLLTHRSLMLFERGTSRL